MKEWERKLEEERKQQEEERMMRSRQCKQFVRNGKRLRDSANLLAKHRQDCTGQLVLDADEIKKLTAKYKGAIAGTAIGAVTLGLHTIGFAVTAPLTLGLTAILAVGTGSAAVAVAAGGGVEADKLRKKREDIKNAQSTRARDWIMRDRDLCGDLLTNVIAYQESWHELREMFQNDDSMHAYLRGQGLRQSSEIQKRFNELSKVVQNWRLITLTPMMRQR